MRNTPDQGLAALPPAVVIPGIGAAVVPPFLAPLAAVVPGPAGAAHPAVRPPSSPPRVSVNLAPGGSASEHRAGTGHSGLPESFRAGYPEYLRAAAMAELAGMALPGLAGIFGLTALGGLVGYRQAKAGHAVRTAGTARFLH
jgi:hypothetical protein